MSALHATRRRLLSCLAVGAASVLAGCLDESADRSVVDDEVHDEVTEPPPEATTDVQVRSVRAPVEEPFVSFGADDSERPNHGHREFILSDEQAEAVEFEIEHDGIEGARSFLEGTDYGSASIVVHQRPIEACYRRRVEYVTVEEDRYYVRFCRRLKPATTRCDPDRTEMEGLFVRVPRAYESTPSSRGRGERSQCRIGGRNGGEDS